MVVLTAEVVQKRLLDIKHPTQEAIETMSLWIMHYKDKASIDLIVDGWLSCFKIASDEFKRIALFYVMNDVVQKAKIKHADMLVPAFQPAVLTAVGIGRRQERVKAIMRRCIQIFRSRNVFSPNSITAMESLLDSEEGIDGEDQALEVDTDDLINRVTKFVEARLVVADIMKCVNEGDFDYSEKCKSGMKDREEGAHILHEVHLAIDTMVKVRRSMEDHTKKLIDLCETLELAKRVFLHQKREVLVVEEAYVNFRDGIKAVHTELLEMEEKSFYPGAMQVPRSPTPSPTGTAEEEPIATSSQSTDDVYRQQGFTSWGDNRAPMDMEIDEDEKPPVVPVIKPSLQNLIGIASQPSLQSRIMQLGLKKIADGDQAFQQAATTTTTTTADATDFSRPPPSIPAFNIPKPAAPAPSSVPLDPRKRPEETGMSQYALALQQHGMLPPGAQTNTAPPAPPVPPVPQPSVYTGHFETRDPRTAPPPVAPMSAYRAQFEPPRQVQPPPPQQTGYQATFDVAPPKPALPQPGVYQPRFEPANANHQPPVQQYQGGFQRAGYGDYNAQKDTDNRFGGAGGGGYHQQSHQSHQGQHQHQSQQSYQGHQNHHNNQNHHRNSGGYEDRRGGPYNRGGGDRWRGGGYNDRGRGNWRGGHRGGYNRY